MIKKLYNYGKSLDKRLKFIFVGGLNTIIGYGVNALMLYFVFSIPFNSESRAGELQVLISSLTGHIMGMINAYFWNKYFTFQSKEKSFKQVLKFLIVSLSQLALSYGLQIFFQNVAGLGIYIAQPITLVITTIFSYLGHNFFTFKKTAEKSSCNNSTNNNKE